jgi:1-acyl-sn-glycerol-3-phosphate acyltransferase
MSKDHQDWRRPGDPPEVLLFLGAVLFWIGFTLSTLIIAPLVILSASLPYARRCQVVSLWTGFNLWTLRVACGLKWQVQGREQLPQEASVVFAKHQSTWETIALQRIFPPLVWVLKRELLRLPFFGWGMAVMEPIAIDRGAGRKAVEQVVEQGRERLARGRWVMVFPEGTRVPPGKRGRYRVGGAVLAERTGAPVVPVAHNAGEYWPRHSFIKRPGTIRVCIGPPIHSRGKTAQEIVREAETWIEHTMKEITTRPELYASPEGAERVEQIPR